MASKYDDDDDYDEKEDSKAICHAESKFSEGESKDSTLTGPDLVQAVQNYFFTDEELSRTFENFVQDRCGVVDLDNAEYRLEYTQIYIEYKGLFEDRMENYINNVLKSSIQEFYVALKSATEQDENSNEAVFGLILLSVTDFDIFMQMLREAKQKERASRK